MLHGRRGQAQQGVDISVRTGWLDVLLDSPVRGVRAADLPARPAGPPVSAWVVVDVDPAHFAAHLHRCLRRL